MVRLGSHAMKIASLFLLLIAAPFVPGCSPSDVPLETIVLGEQVTAEDDGTPIEDPASQVQMSPTIDNITVVGSLIQGQASAIGLSCTVSEVNGTVQSVMADFSAMGGPGDVMLSKGSGKLWVWSGVITATVAGSAMVYFTATDDQPSVATEEKSVFVAASTQSGPTQPPGVTPDDPAEPPVVAAGQEGENIALGRTYAWSVAPNHSECTDAGDATQVTDGRHAEGLFTNDKSWVGWKLERSNAWVALTIDFGQVQPIRGASFRTIACVDAQEWPMAIGILVSDDGTHYYHAGELTSLSAQHGLPTYTIDYTWSKITHTYSTDRLDTHGRFVRFVVANYPHIFVDEIGVYRGHDDMLSRPLASMAVADLAAYVRDSKVRCGIIRRIVLDAQDVRSQVRAAAPFAGQADLEAVLLGVISQAMYLDGPALYSGAEAGFWPAAGDPSQFRAILPLNDLHRQVFRAQATLWQAQGKQGLTAWQSPLWDSLGPTQIPGLNLPGVIITTMQNEYRAGAFNLSNATNSDLTVNVNIHGLPGGTNPSYVSVQPVPWTDTQRGVPVAAALPVATRGIDGFAVHIPSGMTLQVWMTFRPTGVAGGTYVGTITADGGTAGMATVPLQLRVSRLVFPSQPTLSLGGWDKTDIDNSTGLTPQNRSALISHLREHFVDTPWGTVHSMWPKPVPTNPVKRAEHFRLFDDWVARWRAQPGGSYLPVARSYYIHMMGVVSSFDGHSVGTQGFRVAVGQWIRDWVAHWQEIGLDPKQIGLMIVDEPETAEECNTIKQWAEAIRAADPDVRIWQDQILYQPYATGDASGELSDPVRGALEVSDVLCPNRVTFLADPTWRAIYRQQRDNRGAGLHFYSCLASSHWLDPYTYARLQAWTCWQEGATATFYWSFSDNGRATNDTEPASSWNEYLAKWSYTPLYLDATTVTGGKHMEAIREGIEDYEYLATLRSRIAALRAAGSVSPQVAAAETLLNQAVSRVLEVPGEWFWPDQKFAWTNQVDRGAADEVRIEILDMLETLDSLAPN